jgi:hypothetical protein
MLETLQKSQESPYLLLGTNYQAAIGISLIKNSAKNIFEEFSSYTAKDKRLNLL